MKRLICSAALSVIFFLRPAAAQVPISAGTYSQNFDSLASSGTANTWTDNSTLPGWYASKQVAPNAVTTYRADSGSGNAGALYSYGATSSANRALGVLVSGTPGNIAFGLRFTNDTGVVQSNIAVSFTAEQWRNANTAAQTLAFFYQTGAGLTNSDGTNALAWNSFSALNFITPTIGSSSGTALDGTAAANQSVFTNVILSGVTVPAGQEIFLRWYFTRPASGSSHAVAVENLTVSFSATNLTASNSPPSITAQPQSQTNNAGDTVTFSVTAGGTAPLSYQWKSNSVAVMGATNSSFTLANVATNLSGSSYFVTITNIAGSTNSQMATLTVNASQANSAAITSGSRILRIATYNIAADVTSGYYGPLPGLIAPPSNTNNVQAGGVLEGIGEEFVNGNAQPLDILAMQETTTNTLTVVPIVNGLNSFYGVAGMYSNSTYQATQFGGSGNNGTGNGPNALVYNSRTVQLLASTPVDPPGGIGSLGSASGEYREVMRYQFAPAGVASNANNNFYIYVSHYKSGAASTPNNTNSRAGEAFIVRSNMANFLPPAARILHVGDFNTGDASETMYFNLTAPGTNQLIDPLNPANSLTTNFDSSTTPGNLTESATSLQYRDDYQMMTTNVFYGAPGGLALVPGTYHHFGNNGTTAFNGKVSAAGNTALNSLVTNGPVFISAAQLFMDLTNASDHLPVVADYTIPIPAPKITGATISGTNLNLSATNGITNAVYFVLMNTNLNSALTNWTAVASNAATTGNFSFTATNVITPAAPQRFFILKTQ